MWSSPKWLRVWKSSLLSECLWHFATLYNSHFLTVDGHLENPRFYEHLWHLTALHKRRWASFTREKFDIHTTIHIFCLSITLLVGLHSLPGHGLQETIVVAVCQQTCWFHDERRPTKPAIDTQKLYTNRTKLTAAVEKTIEKGSAETAERHTCATIQVHRSRVLLISILLVLSWRKHGHWSSHTGIYSRNIYKQDR